MCKKIQENYFCGHHSTFEIPNPTSKPCDTDFQGEHSFDWEQQYMPYPCRACEHRHETPYTNLHNYFIRCTTGHSQVLTHIDMCLFTQRKCDELGLPAILTKKEQSVLQKAIVRLHKQREILQIFITGVWTYIRQRSLLISRMKTAAESDDPYDIEDMETELEALDILIEALLDKYQFVVGESASRVAHRFSAPFRLGRLVKRCFDMAPSYVFVMWKNKMAFENNRRLSFLAPIE